MAESKRQGVDNSACKRVKMLVDGFAKPIAGEAFGLRINSDNFAGIVLT